MDYIKFRMRAGQDIVEHMMPKENAEQIVAAAQDKRFFVEKGKHYVETDTGYIFAIKKPGKEKNVVLLSVQ